MKTSENGDGSVYYGSADLARRCRPPRGAATLDRLVEKDSRFANWWHEGSDGYWVELAPGFAFEDCHCVHEWTVKDVLASARLVEPCDCDDCRATLGGEES